MNFPHRIQLFKKFKTHIFTIKMLTGTFVVTVVVEGELRAPEPGEPGDPGEPGFNEADDGGLDRLVLVEPEKASLKLGFCLPDKLDFPSTSLSSVSFTGGRDGEVEKKWSLSPFKCFLACKKTCKMFIH